MSNAHLHPIMADALGLYSPKDLSLYRKPVQKWFAVEVRVGEDREQVIEVHAQSKHEAFAMALKTLTSYDIDRACDGVQLRILGN